MKLLLQTKDNQQNTELLPWEAVFHNILEFCERPWLANKKDLLGVQMNARQSPEATQAAIKPKGWIINLHDHNAAHAQKLIPDTVHWISLARPGALAGYREENAKGAWWCSLKEVALHTQDGFEIYEMHAIGDESDPVARMDIIAGMLAARLCGISPEELQLWAFEGHLDGQEHIIIH